MADSNWSGPVISENGFRVDNLTDRYYFDIDTDGSLKIGAGAAVGTNVGIEIDSSGQVTIDNIVGDLVPSSGLIKQEDDAGSVEMTGSDAADEGGNYKAYGSSHATKANDTEIRTGSDVILGWDDSAGTLCLGKDAGSIIEMNVEGQALAMRAGAGNEAVIRMTNNDGNMQITGGSNTGNGPDLVLYGGSHATQALDIVLRDNSDDVLHWDNSDSALELAPSGAKLGFLGATPVVRQPTISDPAGGATVDAEARSAINDILDLLQAYGGHIRVLNDGDMLLTDECCDHHEEMG